MSIPGFQQRFHEDWHHLQNPHVRSLAWLLTSPHLLDADLWGGAFFCPDPVPFPVIHDYLSRLDQNPATLQQLITARPVRRLGLYAELLFSHFLNEFFHVWSHGLQIRDDRGRTIGEFDFQVMQEDGLLHWELASKFYLFCRTDITQNTPACRDYLGPNLSDRLDLKIHKMLDHQLKLGQNEFAQAVLPQPLLRSQAWVNGWLFYPPCLADDACHFVSGVARDHCRGLIWTWSEFETMSGIEGLLLDRLSWLAPAACASSQLYSHQALIQQVQEHFARTDTPLLFACMQRGQVRAHEVQRAMLVPDDWFVRAQRSQHSHRV